eukprot:CAMPEP_0197021324 /NCGR_PEP_ID=MMETSP1384-20130603/2194_1 /TAXON_ID=29189 /ORGANISM="Ammonia sp." /LENGTH=585 /DNA_ID=CAMNT_0042449125 /DNA_START=32 /DNA_END=1789 /DNA_ORIENTATION=+
MCTSQSRIETFTVSKWKQHQEKYDGWTEHPSEAPLLHHFGGGHEYKETCHFTAIDVDHLDFPATQTLIDHWHLSAQSAQQYASDTLATLQILSHSLLTAFTAYFIQFTRLFYTPIQLYLSQQPDHDVLVGDLNPLLQLILHLAIQLQQRQMPSIAMNRASVHIDVQCTFPTKLTSSSTAKQSHPVDTSSVNEDHKTDEADFEHPFEINECKQPPTEPAFDCNGYDLREHIEKTVERMARLLFHGIDRAYNHYLLHVDRAQIVRMHQLHSTVPQCSIEYVPLCRLFNTIQTMKRQHLQSHQNLFNLSLHKYEHHVSLYILLCTADGKVYGSRVDLRELHTIMQQLFDKECTEITPQTQALLDRVSRQFHKDPAMQKLADFLAPQEGDGDDDEKEQEVELDVFDEYVLQERLEQFAAIHNEYRLPHKQVNLYELQHIFYHHGFDAAYFQTATHRREFVAVLRANGTAVGTARKLWNVLAPPVPRTVSTPSTPDSAWSGDAGQAVIGSYSYIPGTYSFVIQTANGNDIDSGDLDSFRLDEHEEEAEEVDDDVVVDDIDDDDASNEDVQDEEGYVDLEEEPLLSVPSDW